jgi:CubicO group peptidase (beta-lactamase class C family)
MIRGVVFLLSLTASGIAQDITALTDATVQHARTEFNVPGISVAIVKDGKVVLSKGYGVRRLGEPAPMSDRTLVGIASNSKAFTDAALALLVDEGKLKWDDRVIDRLPEFALSDAYVTREMRIRDLPAHRSGLGLGAGDLMFWPATNLSTADVIYRLRFVPLETSFRSQYAYDNVLYNVIGAVIEKVSGQSWSRFIHDRFFVPLGMTSSLTSIAAVKPGDDVVSPHAREDGVLKALPHEPLDNNAPAGAIVSSAADLTKWVATLLNKGVMPDGKRLISEEQVRTLRTPLIFMPNPEPPKEISEMKSNFTAYAMGEVVREYRGHLLIYHTGGLQGMVTEISLLPEQNLGVIVLTNQESNAAFQSVTNTILDFYLGAAAKDWVSTYAELVHRNQDAAKKVVSEATAKRNADSKPGLPLASYAGRYRDPWYGDVLITESGGKLAMSFTHTPRLTGTLEHWQYETFVVRWKDRSMDADAYVTFELTPEGKIDLVRMKAVSPTTDFSFDFHDLRLAPVVADAAPWD